MLFRPLLGDTLLCIAEEDLFVPLWSPDIRAELERNLTKHGIAQHAVGYRIAQMTAHFPGAMVTGDEFLLDLHELDPAAVRRAPTRQVSRYRRQPRTLLELLAALGRPGNGCPRFAR